MTRVTGGGAWRAVEHAIHREAEALVLGVEVAHVGLGALYGDDVRDVREVARHDEGRVAQAAQARRQRRHNLEARLLGQRHGVERGAAAYRNVHINKAL